MNRWILLLIVALTVLAVDTRPASAWVIIRVLPKGHVPNHRFPESVTSLLREVPPIHGYVIDGFSHYTCSLHFRGTQNDVQEVLDGLGKVSDINLVVKINRTGKVGLVMPGNINRLERPVPFLYQVDLHQNDFAARQVVNPAASKLLPKSVTVTLTVYSAGGLEPDKLQIPDRTIESNKLRAAKMAKVVVDELTSDLKLVVPKSKPDDADPK